MHGTILRPHRDAPSTERMSSTWQRTDQGIKILTDYCNGTKIADDTRRPGAPKTSRSACTSSVRRKRITIPFGTGQCASTPPSTPLTSHNLLHAISKYRVVLPTSAKRVSEFATDCKQRRTQKTARSPERVLRDFANASAPVLQRRKGLMQRVARTVLKPKPEWL